MKDIRNHSLLRHNTFGIDARCDRFIEFERVEELKTLIPQLKGKQFLILGGGSNLLLTGDYHGIVLHSAIIGFSVRQMGNDIFIRCGSGEIWDDIVALCVENGWYGAENLSFIPGEIGATAVQNIGAYGTEIKDIIHEIAAVDVQTGEEVCFSNTDCDYRYRSSRFKHEWKNRYVITHVTYRLSRIFTPRLEYGNLKAVVTAAGDGLTPQSLRQSVIGIRKEKLPDPAIEGNAGSFFMNPVIPESQFIALQSAYPQIPSWPAADGTVKVPAAWLIEQCGWKGRTLGRAAVHGRQPLVLVNRGGATGDEIVRLAQAITTDVEQHFHIRLTPEVNIV
ncbi:MAG: UDP-N-acetylmuramate dehydrogenase [Prevotella sp.]|nr:UDP-N-acetylmuramate dehydrogenase [Prevotella sp.]